jgi:hypothetical protein
VPEVVRPDRERESRLVSARHVEEDHAAKVLRDAAKDPARLREAILLVQHDAGQWHGSDARPVAGLAASQRLADRTGQTVPDLESIRGAKPPAILLLLGEIHWRLLARCFPQGGCHLPHLPIRHTV